MKHVLILTLLVAIFGFTKGEEHEIASCLSSIKVGDPIEYKNLKIFPILGTKVLSLKDYVILDEAMARDWLTIREISSGEVNFVEVKNKGAEPVFIMTGEMITGAKQDRMLKEDVLLPQYSGWVRVPVFCVEHGRWTGVSHEFKSGGRLVPNAVREKAKITDSQSEVWGEIARSQDQMGIVAGTGTVNANYENEEVSKALTEYTSKFKGIPKLSKSTIGVVVTTGNRIICFDLFANNNLLGKLWQKLLKSYAMDAISGEKSQLDKNDLEDFLEALDDAQYIAAGTPGLGSLLTIESDFGRGSVLCFKSTVIHLDFFPTQDVRERGSGLRLDLRRDQRLSD